MFFLLSLWAQLINVFVKAAVGLVFWFFWDFLGVGHYFFDFLPEKYLNPGVVMTIGLFVVISILFSFFPSPSNQKN